MKLILREKQIQEASLKASQSLIDRSFNYIYNEYYGAGLSSGQALLHTPIKDLVVAESKLVVIGAVIMYYKILKGETIKGNDELKNLWEADKKDFKQSIKTQILNSRFPILFAYEFNLPNDSAGLTALVDYNGISIPVFAVGIQPHTTEAKFKVTLRHEVQHVTQIFGTMCLYYYELLKRSKFNFDEIEEPRLILSMSEYERGDHQAIAQLKKSIGLGKRKTNVKRMPRPKEEDYADKKEYEAALEKYIENYFSLDQEFETWTSDLAEEYVEFLTETGILTPQEVAISYFIEKYPMFAKSRLQEQSTVQGLQALKILAKMLNSNFEDTRYALKTGQGLNELAISLVGELISNPYVVERLTKHSGDSMYEKGLKYVLKARPKEAKQEIINKVKQKLINMIEKVAPLLKTL